MDKTIIVALISSGVTAVVGPIMVALVADWLAKRKEEREEQRLARKEARERAAKNAVRSQGDAIRALERHLAEVTEDRNSWRERALYYERMFGGMERWVHQ